MLRAGRTAGPLAHMTSDQFPTTLFCRTGSRVEFVRGVYAPWPPKAVLGPALTPGWSDDKTMGLSGPLTGLLLRCGQTGRPSTGVTGLNGEEQYREKSTTANPCSSTGPTPPAAGRAVNGPHKVPQGDAPGWANGWAFGPHNQRNMLRSVPAQEKP